MSEAKTENSKGLKFIYTMFAIGVGVSILLVIIISIFSTTNAGGKRARKTLIELEKQGLIKPVSPPKMASYRRVKPKRIVVDKELLSPPKEFLEGEAKKNAPIKTIHRRTSKVIIYSEASPEEELAD